MMHPTKGETSSAIGRWLLVWRRTCASSLSGAGPLGVASFAARATPNARETASARADQLHVCLIYEADGWPAAWMSSNLLEPQAIRLVERFLRKPPSLLEEKMRDNVRKRGNTTLYMVSLLRTYEHLLHLASQACAILGDG